MGPRRKGTSRKREGLAIDMSCGFVCECTDILCSRLRLALVFVVISCASRLEIPSRSRAPLLHGFASPCTVPNNA